MTENDQLIRRIRALVSVRESLRHAGAGDEELERQSADIRRLQGALAERVRRSMRENERQLPAG
jgi:hypothetical protein